MPLPAVIGAAGTLITGTAIVAGTAATIASRAVGAFNTLLPQYTEVVSVVVHMNRNGTKADALYLAFSTAFSQLTKPGGSQPITAAAIGAGGGNLFQEGVQVVTDMLKSASAIIPPASVYKVQYDAMDRWIQVTVSQRWGGIVDWTTGGIGGGWKSITTPPDDGVIGGDWPQSAMVNQLLSGAYIGNPPPGGTPAGNTAVPSLNSIADQVTASLPRLKDAGLRIATGLMGPGLVPPEILQFNAEPKVADAQMPKQQKIGTDLMRIIANSLGAGCSSAQSPKMQKDLSASINQDLKIEANPDPVNPYSKYPYQSGSVNIDPPVPFPPPPG